ncbi:MerR family transcriptional regulator [Priestia megaterium]
MGAVILTYSIGGFSKIVGLSEHTLRFYEKD